MMSYCKRAGPIEFSELVMRGHSPGSTCTGFMKLQPEKISSTVTGVKILFAGGDVLPLKICNRAVYSIVAKQTPVSR